MRYFKGLKKIVFITVCFFSLIDIRSFSQEEVDKSKNKTEKKKDVKEFTEKQLNEYVIKELEKKLKKIGRSKILSFSKELFKKEEDLKLIELNHTLD